MQITAEFSECWAVCRIHGNAGQRAEFSKSAGQTPAEFSECWAVCRIQRISWAVAYLAKERELGRGFQLLRPRLIEAADKNDYVSARTRSKAHLETNKAIMSKVHEEGGDVTSSDHLASAFLLLGITETSEDEIEPIIESVTIECENESEPLTYKAALRSPQAREWQDAMRQQLQALVENHTFDSVAKGNTVHIPMTDRTVEEPIGCKWIYKRKINPDGSTRYKVRLVIKGYEQREGIDYDETYTPVSKMATFRLILALATQYGWDVDLMDVVTAFLNPSIDRDNIYMEMLLWN